MHRCSFLPMVCISTYQYNLGVKGQGQNKTKSCNTTHNMNSSFISTTHNMNSSFISTTHNMNSSFISTTLSVHIWHNNCLWGVDNNVGFYSPLCHWCQKTRSNKLTISLWLVTRTPTSFFDQGCSYLAQLLLMVCKLQSTLHITAMALESKVN